MKTMILDRQDAIKAAGERLKNILEAKPNAVLALSVGEDELEAYKLLRGSDFAAAQLVLVGEFCGLEKDDPRRLQHGLAETLGVEEGKILVPDAADPESFDKKLPAIDAAFLGLGYNAAIGFNEPATPFASMTHTQKLTHQTRLRYAESFGSEDAVPEQGVTLGISQLVRAKEQIVLALGQSKQKAAFAMLYGRDDSTAPAAFLQLAYTTTVCLDREAAESI